MGTLKKICCITDSFNSGGAQKQMVMLANGISQFQEYNVITLQYHDLNFFSKYLSNNIERYHIIESNKILRVIKIILFLKKQKPDCIITFLNGPNNYAALYKCIFFWRKTRLLVGERNLDVQKLKLKDFLKRFSHIVAHKIICNSNAQLIKLSPYYGNKLVFISNGTDINGIVKKQYNIAKYDNNTKKFIVSARVVSQKNPLLLLKAIQILKNEFDFEVHWYGEIYNNDPVVKQCIDYIIQNELSSYFRFQSPTNDIYQVMKNYDALILPSFYEGCPNAVIDAMFCGLPVLASHVSDNMMYLRHQKELIFNPHLVGDLVDKLRYFFTLPVTDVINIGNENYNKAKYFFDQNKMVSKYVKLMNA